MPWELQLRTPGGALFKTVTNGTDPNPIMGPPEVIVDAGGRTNSINLRARNDILKAGPRFLIQYREWAFEDLTFNGQPLTFNSEQLIFRVWDETIGAGVIVTSPPITSPGSGPADRDADALDRITAVGLEKLLQERIVGARLFEGDMDVAQIAYQLALEYGHPAILVQAGMFPNTGHSLGFYYSPEKTLAAALGDLAETVPDGARWYVDHGRRLVFEAGA